VDSRVSVLIDIRSRLAGLQRASAGFKHLIRAVAGFTAAYLSMREVIRGGRDIIKLGAEAEHTSGKLGTTVKELMLFRQAAEDNGIAASSADMALQRFTRRLAEARQGSGELKGILEQYNIQLYDSAGNARASGDVLRDLGAIMESTDDSAERLRIAFKAFDSEGAGLVNLFNGPGGLNAALGDASESLGELPEVMQRNAGTLERIDTLIGRLPNKTRQVFAGIADEIATELIGPLERLDDMDFTGLGKSIGEGLGIGIEAIRQNRLGELLSLVLQAGIEEAGRFFREEFRGSIAHVFSQDFVQQLNAARFAIASTLLEIFEQPVRMLVAAINFALARVRREAGNLIPGFQSDAERQRQERIEAIEQRMARIRSRQRLSQEQIDSNAVLGPDQGGLSRPILGFDNPELVADLKRGMARNSEELKGLVAELERLQRNELRFKDFFEDTAGVIAGAQSDLIDQGGSALASAPGFTSSGTPAEDLKALVAELNAAREKSNALADAYRNLGEAAGQAGEDQEQMGREITVVGTAANSAQSGLTSAFRGILEGTTSAQGAFLTFTSAVVTGFTQMIAQALAYKAITSTLGFLGLGNPLGPLSFGLFASGGFTGAGPASEPAGIVHKGEFVIPAEATQRLGVGNLNRLVAGSSLPRYDQGGMAGSAPGNFGAQAGAPGEGGGQTTVQVGIINMESEFRRFLEGSGQKVLLDAMKKNRTSVGVFG